MSIKRFEATLLGLLSGGAGGEIGKHEHRGSARLPDPADQVNPGEGGRTDTARALNAAFLITLAGPGHPLFWEADVLFEKIIRTEEGSKLGRFYQQSRSAVWREIEPLGGDEAQLVELEEVLAALALVLRSPAKNAPPESGVLSKIPVTRASLQTALAAATLFAEGRADEATRLLEQAAASTGSP